MPFSPFPTNYLNVELFYSGAWVSITADVTSEGVTITRGQPNEGPTTATPSSMTVTVLNPAGKYSPRNPRRPLYGLIGRGTPIRVYVRPQGGVGVFRYVGRVYEWPVSWGVTGGPSVVSTLVCSGVLRQLAQSAPPAVSPATRAGSVQPGLLGYWPLEDVKTARWDAVVGSDVSVGYGVALAAAQPWAGSKALTTLSTGKFTGNAGTYVNTGAAQFRWVGRFTESMSFGVLMSWTFKGGTVSRIDFDHASAGQWFLRSYDSSGDLIQSNGIAITALLGVPAQYGVQVTQVAANVNVQMSWIAQGAPGGQVTNITLTAQTLGLAASFKINPNVLNWANNEIGHVAIGNVITDVFAIRAQLEGYPNESATTRLQRVTTEEAIPLAVAGGGEQSPAMGTQSIVPTVDIFAEILAVGQGMLFETRYQDGLYYRSATDTFNRTPKLTITYTDNLIRPLDPVDDDQNTANTVTVNRTAGGTLTVNRTAGALGIGTVGDYETQSDINVYAESQLLDQANWRLARGTLDAPRWPRLGLDLAHPTFLSSAPLTTAALAVDIGDWIQITNLPAWLPPDPIRQRVIGITETITPFNHRLEFNTDPASLLDVGKFDDTKSRYSGDGTVLTAAIDASVTAVNITPPAGVRWTAIDGPYDVVCGGERMTVTAVTGNTLTVTRAVAGYGSPHPAGRAIDLDPIVPRYSI